MNGAPREPGAAARLLGHAHLLAYRAWARSGPRVAAPVTGILLGVLGRGGLHAIDAAMYRQRRHYRADAHNLRGLWPWEEEAVARHFPARGRVLVTAAGGGREVVALARRGYEARGYECNPALVGAAARLLPRVAPEGGASVEWLPRDVPPPPGAPFDAAIVGWSAYSLVAGRAHRVRYLAGIRGLLAGDAPVLLSFFTRPEGSPWATAVARHSDRVRRLLGRAPVEPGDDLGPNFLHRFTAAELEAELAAAGLRAVELRPPGPGRYDSAWAVARPFPDGR